MRKNNKLVFGASAIAIGVALTPFATSESTASLLRGSQEIGFGQASIGDFAGIVGHNDGVDGLATGSINTGFFRTSAISFANLAAQKDWNRVRSAELDVGRSTCSTGACKQRISELSETMSQFDEASFYEKLQAVNSTVNQSIKYAPDSHIYRKKDHWASANQTVEVGLGDCEDFAILKHAMLLKAGVPASSMSLIVLKDTDRNLYHAVLAVSTNKGHLILDNVAKDVYRDTSIAHYQPLFSFSDDRSWIHGVAENSSKQLLAQGSAPFDAVAPGETTFDVASLGDFDLSWTEDLRPVQSDDQEWMPNLLY